MRIVIPQNIQKGYYNPVPSVLGKKEYRMIVIPSYTNHTPKMGWKSPVTFHTPMIYPIMYPSYTQSYTHLPPIIYPLVI